RAKLAFKHPHSLSIPALGPPAWGGWLLLGGLLSLFVPYLGWVWLTSVALYVAVLLAAGVVVGRRPPRGVGLRIPLVFVAIHFGFAWGFWKEVAKQLVPRLRCGIAPPRNPQPTGAS